jgi:hypothetical protein
MGYFFHIVKSALLYNTNIYFFDFIEYSYCSSVFILLILLNTVLLQFICYFI